MKPVCIIEGNCNGEALTQMLKMVPEFSATFEVVFSPSFRGPDPRRSVCTEDQIRRCALLLNQVTHWEPELDLPRAMSPTTRIIRYPILFNNTLWPLNRQDPRPFRGLGLRGERFPYGDSLLLQLMKQGEAQAVILERYLATDLMTLVDLDRFHEINVIKGKELDLESDITINSYIAENFSHVRLFSTFNHPRPNLLLRLAAAVLHETGMGHLTADVVRQIAENPPLNRVEIPIHPQVARHFGVTWFEENARYRFFEFGDITFREYLEICLNPGCLVDKNQHSPASIS
ncbi:MAG: WcbI family polysaccharide biosynthesis putative acetyltransferase [bacterium]